MGRNALNSSSLLSVGYFTSLSNSVFSDDRMITMNWNEFGRKWPWSDRNTICLEGPSKTTKNK